MASCLSFVLSIDRTIVPRHRDVMFGSIKVHVASLHAGSARTVSKSALEDPNFRYSAKQRS